MEIRNIKAQKDGVGNWRAVEDNGQRFRGTLYGKGGELLPAIDDLVAYWREQGYEVAHQQEAGTELHITLQRRPEPQTDLERFEAWRAENRPERETDEVTRPEGAAAELNDLTRQW